MNMKTAKIKNLLTGEETTVTATTDHWASSYGKAVWVTEEGDAIGQVGIPLFGYEIIETHDDESDEG